MRAARHDQNEQSGNVLRQLNGAGKFADFMALAALAHELRRAGNESRSLKSSTGMTRAKRGPSAAQGQPR